MTPSYEVTGIGEIMLRLSVPNGTRIELCHSMDVHPGGAEGNVLSALSCLGRKTSWVGGLPDNPLGQLVRNHLRRANVGTEGIIWKEDSRMGLFFIEFSGPPRATQVHYDRANSAAAVIDVDDVPWDILMDTKVIHLSGITPALSPSCLRITQEAIIQARKRGVLVSFDINFRRKLWSEARALEVLTPLVQGVDVLFCGRGDATGVFSCQGEPEEIARQLMHITHAKNLVLSLGNEGALAWDRNTFFRSEQTAVQIVDPIGAGDAMAAGVLHGWLDGDLKKGLEVGMIMAGIALSQTGDAVSTSLREVDELLRTKEAAQNNRRVNR